MWLATYELDGRIYGIDIPGETENEAIRHLAAILQSGKLEGQIYNITYQDARSYQ